MELTITYSEVFERCKMLASFEARDHFDESGDSLYPESILTEQEQTLVYGWLSSAALVIEENIARLVLSATPAADSITWHLRLSERWNSQRTQLATYIQEALVSYALYKWYEMKWPENVAKFKTLWDESLQRIISNVFRRRQPFKRPRTVLPLNITLVEEETQP